MGAWTLLFGHYGGSPPVLAVGIYSVSFSATEPGTTFTTAQPGTAFTTAQPGTAFNGDLTVGIVTRLADSATEEGTFAVTAVFTDEDGGSLTPTLLSWTLSRTDGTIVNGRQDVSVLSPAASEEIVLSGDDLQLFTDDNRRRRLTLEGTFSSDLGSDLPLTAECEFLISSFVGVT